MVATPRSVPIAATLMPTMPSHTPGSHNLKPRPSCRSSSSRMMSTGRVQRARRRLRPRSHGGCCPLARHLY
eukprot:scaffold28012_cov32-Tisochrysis_lutea.AAC.7